MKLPRRHEGTKSNLYKAFFVSSCLRGVFPVLMMVSAACAPTVGKTPDAGSVMPASIVEPYLQIWDALADDKLDDVKANAGNIANASTALGAPAMKISTSALSLAGAAGGAEPDIADVRQKFGALSEAIDTYMTGLNLKAPEGVRVAVCPMVHKPWLQKGDTIANPYYGREMPTCGNFR